MSVNNTNGIAAEERVSFELLELGYVVSKPVVDAPYDLVVEIENNIVRVQVKRGYPDKQREGRIRVNMTRSGDSKYSSDEIDVFAIYDPIYERVYWMEYEEAPKNELRNKPSNLKKYELRKELL